MQFTINSKKFGVKITFTHFADEGKTSYLWANTNGMEGTLGNQCMKPTGSAIKVTEKNARRIAHAWIERNFAENL